VLPADATARAASFVQSYAEVSGEHHALARWLNPICVRVVGLKPDQAAAVRTRIEDVAKALAIRIQPAKCRRSDIEIGFTNDPQGMLDGVIKDAKQTLGDQTSGTSADKTVIRPIQAWYVTNGAEYAANSTDGNSADGLKALVDDRGPGNGAGLKILVQQYMTPQSTGPFGPGAIATPDISDNSGAQFGFGALPPWLDDQRGPRQFLNVFVIVDLRSTGNKSLALLTDYVAMVVLSQPRSLDHCNALPSITDLYAGSCPGRGAPDGLTPADAAYLTALYTTPEDNVSPRREPGVVLFKPSSSAEASDVVDRMAQRLANTEVAAR
jgi:hypothetical protein